MTTTLWAATVLVCLLMYVVLDGYDLGIGVATLFERDPVHRRHMLESVAVGWDGNETWLILLGVALWAGFPLAFGTILPHAYLPMIVVLFSLIVRGVSVEMASQAPPAPRWTTAFSVASLLAAFGQGFALGTLTSAVHVRGNVYTGSAFGAFSWFCVLSGLTVTAAYTALGYAYTKHKSSGRLRESAARRGAAATAVGGVLLVVLLFTVDATAAPLDLDSPGRAFAFAGLLLFAAGGGATSLVTFPARRQFRAADSLPLGGLVIATVSVFLALAVARYPVLVPPGLSVDSAAGPHATMVFILVGIGLNMPLVLAYNVFAHRAFAGKFHTELPGDEPPAAHGPLVTGATLMTTRDPGHAASLPAPLRVVLRLLAAVVWTVLGLLAYFVCQGMFGGYRQIHSQLLTTLGMIAIALTGGIAWIVDERRPHDDA
ncbi:cytochrome d ubiquinol oxidase subunit II [Streptomyces sporangiiformans]|uniref:Cytochrome d ubiquinol oxidase subunit II n=1 Tax=Streptomyces sporangiiformans TaxID=2315329 RepID=A0A505D9V5_9ACTN|nr:cytochrome d ubiquinol oxidase subunit II [Streptomyces sporangiiformans]TPQ19440.1 cytochrome d ubiquinol oxidase subunit II [Streptomyces sporangiiformans]